MPDSRKTIPCIKLSPCDLTTAGLVRYAQRWQSQHVTPPHPECADCVWPDDARFKLFCGDLAETLAALPSASIHLIFTQPPPLPQAAAQYEILAREAPRLLCPGGSALLITQPGVVPDVLALFSKPDTANLRFHWMLAFYDAENPFSQVESRRAENYWMVGLWFVNGVGFRYLYS